MNPKLNKLRDRLLRRHVRLQLHGATYRPDSFVLMLRYCANLEVIRYESTSLNRNVADKWHRVIVALDAVICLQLVLQRIVLCNLTNHRKPKKLEDKLLIRYATRCNLYATCLATPL